MINFTDTFTFTCPWGCTVNACDCSVPRSTGCRFIWTTDERPIRRCVTHEYDWRPPFEPMCPGATTAGVGTEAGDE